MSLLRPSTLAMADSSQPRNAIRSFFPAFNDSIRPPNHLTDRGLPRAATLLRGWTTKLVPSAPKTTVTGDEALDGGRPKAADGGE